MEMFLLCCLMGTKYSVLTVLTLGEPFGWFLLQVPGLIGLFEPWCQLVNQPTTSFERDHCNRECINN